MFLFSFMKFSRFFKSRFLRGEFILTLLLLLFGTKVWAVLKEFFLLFSIFMSFFSNSCASQNSSTGVLKFGTWKMFVNFILGLINPFWLFARLLNLSLNRFLFGLWISLYLLKTELYDLSIRGTINPVSLSSIDSFLLKFILLFSFSSFSLSFKDS